LTNIRLPSELINFGVARPVARI